MYLPHYKTVFAVLLVVVAVGVFLMQAFDIFDFSNRMTKHPEHYSILGEYGKGEYAWQQIIHDGKPYWWNPRGYWTMWSPDNFDSEGNPRTTTYADTSQAEEVRILPARAFPSQNPHVTPSCALDFDVRIYSAQSYNIYHYFLTNPSQKMGKVLTPDGHEWQISLNGWNSGNGDGSSVQGNIFPSMTAPAEGGTYRYVVELDIPPAPQFSGTYNVDVTVDSASLTKDYTQDNSALLLWWKTMLYNIISRFQSANATFVIGVVVIAVLLIFGRGKR